MTTSTSQGTGHAEGELSGIASGTGIANGTFGELLQGVLPENDLDFLVTFPITLASVAEFWPDVQRRGVVVHPAGKQKSRRIAERILDVLGHDFGGILELTSNIPEGKGLASSSADLVATARAVGDAFGRHFSEAEIESFIRGIEPSDGVMYPDIVAFYHREVRLRHRLGQLPSLSIVAHDTGGTVDTLQFHKIEKHFTDAEKQEYGRLLSTLTDAVQAQDLAIIGEVTTRSAEMNLKFLPRDDFNQLRRICHEVEGLGLVQAHSGTTLGILLPEGLNDHAERVAHITKACRLLPGTVQLYRSLGFAGAGAEACTCTSAALSGKS
ncbi:kinase [Streptomyces bikiniensis]|uniref:Kinase n=1 Tax=Streptomyces bikiniensis TaxID=1896 RepID=A0ABW8D1L2_STRBI